MLSPAAASLTSSVIGGLMIAGSAGVKIPQISRIVRSQSVYGLAPTAFYAESAVYSAQCAYHLRSGFPFATWGENLALLLQNTVCIVLLRRFGEGGVTVGRAAADAAFFLLLLLALAAWPPSVLPALALVNAPLIVTANLAQILQNRRNRSTGELSALTVLLRWLGAVVRVGTTLWQLKGDRAVLLNHTLGVLCTSTLLAQLWWYGRTEPR